MSSIEETLARGRLGSRVFSRAEVLLGIKNVFDKEPPFDATNSGNGSLYSLLGDARLRSYYLNLTCAF